MECKICGNKLTNEGTIFDQKIGFVHEECFNQLENNKIELETLETKIVKSMIPYVGLKHGEYGNDEIHEHFFENPKGIWKPKTPEEFGKEKCHITKVENLDLENYWYEFAGTFVDADTVEVITADITCECGQFDHTEVGMKLSIPEIINFGLENGFVEFPD